MWTERGAMVNDEGLSKRSCELRKSGRVLLYDASLIKHNNLAFVVIVASVLLALYYFIDDIKHMSIYVNNNNNNPLCS